MNVYDIVFYVFQGWMIVMMLAIPVTITIFILGRIRRTAHKAFVRPVK